MIHCQCSSSQKHPMFRNAPDDRDTDDLLLHPPYTTPTPRMREPMHQSTPPPPSYSHRDIMDSDTDNTSLPVLQQQNLFCLLHVVPPSRDEVTLAEQQARMLHLQYTSAIRSREREHGVTTEESMGDQEIEDVEKHNHNVRVLNRYSRQEGAIYPNVAIPSDIASMASPSHDEILLHRRRPLTPTEEDAVRRRRLASGNPIVFAFFVVLYAVRSVVHYTTSMLRAMVVSLIVFMELCAYFFPPLQVAFSARLPTDVEWALDIEATSGDSDTMSKESAKGSGSKGDERTTTTATATIHEGLAGRPQREVVRAFDSHGRDMKFSMALQDNCVYLYDLKEQKWSNHILRHDFHRDIQVLKWKPHSENILAVGTRHGVCLWDIKRRIGGAVGSIEQTGVMMFLKHDVHGYQSTLVSGETPHRDNMSHIREMPGIDDLDWYPLDKQTTMFACCSRKDHRVIIWHMTHRKSQSSKRGEDAKHFTPEWRKSFITRFNGGIRSIGFSPDGKYLAVFTIGNVFRIYHVNVDDQIHRNRMTNTTNPLTVDPRQWTSEKWKTHGSQPVQCFQWTHNSRFLLLSEQGESKIHVLKMGQQRFGKEQSLDFYFTIDLSEFEFQNAESTSHDTLKSRHHLNPHIDDDEFEEKVVYDGQQNLPMKCCGVIKQFVLDQYGERLVICFEGQESSELIAIMRCDFDTPDTKTPAMPLGYIRGPKGSRFASNLHFWSRFPRGSLLSTVWKSTGRISFYPLYYKEDWGKSTAWRLME